MRDLNLAELTAPIRDFRADAGRDGGLLIRDARGQALLRIVPCGEDVDERREKALLNLRRIQTRVGNHLRDLGVSEEEFDRAVQEDD